jgi:hypothetical protein
MLLGYADNERFERLADLRTTWGLPLLGAVQLLGDQCAVPGTNRVGFDRGGDFRSRLLPQLFPDLGQGLGLGIAES